MALKFIPCESVIGTEVEGVSLRQLPDEATIEAVEDGLERYGVLIFRDQEITPEEQVAWSRAFGPLALTQRVSGGASPYHVEAFGCAPDESKAMWEESLRVISLM